MSAYNYMCEINHCTLIVSMPYVECERMNIDNYNDNVQVVQKLADIIAIMERLKELEDSKMVDC